MNKLIVFIITSLFLTISLFGESAEKSTDFIQYAQAKAKKENKKVMLLFSGLDWCPPCQRFENDILKKSLFKSFAKKNLVYVVVDIKKGGKELVVSIDGEKLKDEDFTPAQISRSAYEMRKKLSVSGVPFAVIFDNDGEPIFTQKGCPSHGNVNEFLKDIRAGIRKAAKK